MNLAVSAATSYTQMAVASLINVEIQGRRREQAAAL